MTREWAMHQFLAIAGTCRGILLNTNEQTEVLSALEVRDDPSSSIGWGESRGFEGWCFVSKSPEIETAPIGKAIVLVVGPDDADGISLDRIFHEFGWSVYTSCEWTLIASATLASAFSTLREMPIPIVLCDCDFMPGGWREMLDHISRLPDPPLLIVTSRLADERLWAEALNLGAYDLLAKPFDAAEAIRILSLAWRHWQDRFGLHHRRTKQRKTTTET